MDNELHLDGDATKFDSFLYSLSDDENCALTNFLIWPKFIRNNI